MGLSAISLLVAALPLRPETVWRRYEEVFDLAVVDGHILAATDGGLLRLDDPTWVVTEGPSELREIIQTNPLALKKADQRTFYYAGGQWSAGGMGRRNRELETGIEIPPEHDWPMDIPGFTSGPAPKAYVVLKREPHTFVGTIDGLYRGRNGAWSREKLPTALPLSRPNGIASLGADYVVGGLNGLYFGHPGAWKRLAADVIRQVSTVGGAVWVVHGNGALDKIEAETSRLYPDVLTGRVKRPWSSCVGAGEGHALFGGQGGWYDGSVEKLYPELGEDVVTAICGDAKTTWIGTQKTGLLRFDGNRVYRWNPGNGLPDTWVTAMCMVPGGLVVATSQFGLFSVRRDQLLPLTVPTTRVTCLARWGKRLVVGGMDGAWVETAKGWQPLATGGEETTSLSVIGARLVVMTDAGVYFFSSSESTAGSPGLTVANRSPRAAKPRP